MWKFSILRVVNTESKKYKHEEIKFPDFKAYYKTEVCSNDSDDRHEAVWIELKDQKWSLTFIKFNESVSISPFSSLPSVLLNCCYSEIFMQCFLIIFIPQPQILLHSHPHFRSMLEVVPLYLNPSSLGWLNPPGCGACTGVWSIYQVSNNWRKLTYPLSAATKCE